AAIGLAGAFGLRRHRQQHDRRRGETLPETWGAAAVVEEQIHSAADTNVLTRLDEALRTVAEHARTQGNALPALLGAFIGPDAVELVILDDSVLPDPWLKSETGAWTLPADAQIAPAPTTISPYPTLVTLGSTDDSTQVLLNLEELGYLGVSASPDHARGALQALALELVESPLADNLHLTLIGFGQELPELFGNGRIEYTDRPDEVLARLARQAERDQDTLVEQHIDSIAAARSIYDTSEMTAPEVVLIASQLTADQQQSLDQILAATPRVAFAAASTASENSQAAWTLDIVDRNTANLVKRDADGGFTFQPAFLGQEQYDGITAYLATATQPAIPTESSMHDPWAAAEIDAYLTDAASAETFLDSVTAVDPTDQLLLNGTTASETAAVVTDVPTYSPDAAQWTSPESIGFDDQAPAIAPVAGDVPASGHLWLHLLGKPAVTTLTAEPPKDGREVLLTEIAALLSIHPGIKHDSIDRKIWPADNFDKLPLEDQPKKKATRRQNYLSRLRNWLGETENGEQAFPKHGDRTGRTGYRLHPDVRSDWDYWQQLIDTTPTAATDAELRTAAELVNDQPFAGTRADRYGWARNLQQHMIATLADALEELATRQIKTGDLSAALTTANRGVTVEPFREGLWRLAIIATHGSDEISKTQELIDQLLANLADIDVDPEPETDELLRALAQFHNGGNALYRIGAIAS
ncbi:AfsR/SARP family transcriptional regulator, partial [Rhodococcoides yunnanense]|uniref:AfsR/SARP family transcriptional regulator n=1 Tax=Rhodococcoides yunnanense TaxID=278209 RepID=UPI0022B17ED7